MGKHTPGERWVLVPRTFSPKESFLVREGASSEEMAIAIVQDQGRGRLIAAAPDLLDALTELMAVLREEAPGTPLNNHRFDALGIKANNAIRKAMLADTPPGPPDPPGIPPKRVA